VIFVEELLPRPVHERCHAENQWLSMDVMTRFLQTLPKTACASVTLQKCNVHPNRAGFYALSSGKNRHVERGTKDYSLV